MVKPQNHSAVEFHPVTSERWSDLELLFGPRGACGGCWCMFFRLTHSEFEHLKGEGNRALLKDIVDNGEVAGILAYQDDQPVGWCSVAPRLDFTALERSRILKPIDDQEVWSVVCFFIERKHRRQGLMLGLLTAAVDFARQHGAKIVEGYPKDPEVGSISPDVFVFNGLLSSFRKSGFVEVARRSPTRPVMRYYINP
jgi:GNAT superfamily N-acetyltransferase